MADIQVYKEVKLKFNDNVQATLSIMLMNGDAKDPVNVYGRISGEVGIENQFVLFERRSSSYVPISPGQNIPLDMPEVNVPSSASALQIKAYLLHYSVLGVEIEIANGNVVFPVGVPGESAQGFVHGRYGNIRVDVLWG